MKRWQVLLGVLAVGSALSGGFALGQGTASRKASEAKVARQEEFADLLTSIEVTAEDTTPSLEPKNARNGGSAIASQLYEKSGRDSVLTDATRAYALTRYYFVKGKTESAVQASQAAAEASLRLQLLQTAQNQRIIELLEKIAAKK